MQNNNHQKALDEIHIRALRTHQGEGLEVYSFFLYGSDVTRIADISRVTRDDEDNLIGFQRPEIRRHVRSIVEFLDSGPVLFPNAIILAMSPEVRFAASRGPRPDGLLETAQSGTLSIPSREPGQRVAWIVDGQQRSLALSRCRNKQFPVPIIAFISDDLEVQREQFILVNKARPLPSRLINELLPETRSIQLPRDLTARRTPSELCQILNRDQKSPFYKLIRRASDTHDSQAVVVDSAVIRMISKSLNNPIGALAPFKELGQAPGNIDAMYDILVTFWTAVKEVFPEAWGKEVSRSRLMHSAGIEAMGVLMDRMWARIGGRTDTQTLLRKALQEMAPHCRWTAGTWEYINIKWNEIQTTPRDIKKLEDTLIRIYSAQLIT